MHNYAKAAEKLLVRRGWQTLDWTQVFHVREGERTELRMLCSDINFEMRMTMITGCESRRRKTSGDTKAEVDRRTEPEVNRSELNQKLKTCVWCFSMS